MQLDKLPAIRPAAQLSIFKCDFRLDAALDARNEATLVV